MLGVVDGNISKAVYLDICNQMNYITIFLLGFGLTAVDEHGMKEVIRRGRWFNLVIGKKIIYYFISLIHQSILKIVFFIRSFSFQFLFVLPGPSFRKVQSAVQGIKRQYRTNQYYVKIFYIQTGSHHHPCRGILVFLRSFNKRLHSLAMKVHARHL